MMHTEVLLDRQGDLPAPSDYQVIVTEVDFLRHAMDDSLLLIRGERLCVWAEAFYNLRGRPYRYQESPCAGLRHVFPSLSSEQAGTLARKMGVATLSPEQISASFVLNCCYPEDYALWQSAPSREHAARWLLWLYTHSPNDAENIILEHFADLLKKQVRDAPEATLYQVITCEQAKSLLWRWLGAKEEKLGNLGEFPIEVPLSLLNEIKPEWMKRLIESRGVYFTQMLAFPLSVALRQELAQLAAQFYATNSTLLTRDILRQLQPYLNTRVLVMIEERLRPPEPATLPQEEAAVLDWFQAEYLPYRRWQAHFGDDKARQRVEYHAQAFACWYLSHYPRWLLEPGWLSFQHSACLRDSVSQTLTLCIILDGLPAWDAEDFARAVSAKAGRLQLQQKLYCFAPLPTVTEFAKDALLKGMPPRLASQCQPIGRILPDNISPKHGLENAQSGEIAFWRVEQPDKAYHFESDDKRERQVHAELEGILQAVQETTESLPDSLLLQIVITSDHGRLFNPKSPRRLAIPDGMQTHGRVAWGDLDQEFDESGFVVDETAGSVAIHGERFEMAHDMLIAWGEDSFQNAKTGSEPYPHGGLFPEEAIIPWFVFVRDATPPALDIMINGKGEAGNVGSLTIKVINLGPMAINCLLASLSNGVQVSGEWLVPSLRDAEFSVSAAPWPTKADLPTLRATLLFRQPNGATFTVEVIPSLEVITLYERDDSLLKDLEL